MIINEWLNYYEKVEILEMLRWNRYMYDDHAKRGALPPYKTVGNGLERIFPKKEFWIWAASKEVAHEIFPQEMPGIYKTERYLYLRDWLDDEEAKRRIYS